MTKHLIHQLPILVKHEKMISEFENLTHRIKAIILYVSHYTKEQFGYQIIWTEFLRTQKQQDYYYSNEILSGNFIIEDGIKHYSKNRNRKTISVHQVNRGADGSQKVIRLHSGFGTQTMSDFELKEICDMVNTVFPYGKNDLKSCIFHKVHGKAHLHFQSAI